MVVALGAAALGVLMAASWWLILGTMASAMVVVSRIPVRAAPGELIAERQLLAIHADLLAACLDAGMAPGSALAAVSTHGGFAGGRGPGNARYDRPNRAPLGASLAALESVASLLALGAGADLAWQPADGIPELAGLAAAARRSAAGGVAMADAVREHAAALRAANTAAAEQMAGRAGVAMTGPLGLCFLPAFLCLGLAPVVVGMLGTLGIF